MKPRSSCGFFDQRVQDGTEAVAPIEGRITRLKLVKRTMFGRAKRDPFESRLIGTG